MYNDVEIGHRLPDFVRYNDYVFLKYLFDATSLIQNFPQKLYLTKKILIMHGCIFLPLFPLSSTPLCPLEHSDFTVCNSALNQTLPCVSCLISNITRGTVG